MATRLRLREALAVADYFDTLIRNEFKNQLPKLGIETFIDIWKEPCENYIIYTIVIPIGSGGDYVRKHMVLFAPKWAEYEPIHPDQRYKKYIVYENCFKYDKTATTTKEDIVADNLESFCEKVIEDLMILIGNRYSEKLKREITEAAKEKYNGKMEKYIEEKYNERKAFVLDCLK